MNLICKPWPVLRLLPFHRPLSAPSKLHVSYASHPLHSSFLAPHKKPHRHNSRQPGRRPLTCTRRRSSRGRLHTSGCLEECAQAHNRALLRAPRRPWVQNSIATTRRRLLLCRTPQEETSQRGRICVADGDTTSCCRYHTVHRCWRTVRRWGVYCAWPTFQGGAQHRANSLHNSVAC